jgi:excisionase family DNA binding protein
MVNGKTQEGGFSIDLKDFLSTDDLVAMFKVTRKTIERWRKEGLPFIKIGSTVRFEQKEVIEWVKKHKQI